MVEYLLTAVEIFYARVCLFVRVCVCVGWLFGVQRPFETEISVYIGPSPKDREKEEKKVGWLVVLGLTAL